MKELSIEEKAKRYDEAIETARKINSGDGVAAPSDWTTCEVIFPELKESEDERIRKGLIQYFSTFTLDTFAGLDPKKILAWLEKQGEIDKISYEIAEKEKREFVGDGFIKCYAGFQDFKEGETYWLEYLGNDDYNVRSDNLLGKTYHITPCQLYTIFKKQTWLEKQGEQKPTDKVEPKFKVGDEIKTKNEESLIITRIDRWGYWSEDLFICNFDDADNWELVEQKPTDKIEPKFHEGDIIKEKETGNLFYVNSIEDFGYTLHYKNCITKGCTTDFKYEDNYELVEQKPNKVKPKFKVSDWVIGRATNNEPRHISEITDQYYKSTYGGQYGFSFEDEMHLWTIADAKDGDVLIDKSNGRECQFIFKETKPSDIKTDVLNPLTVLGYCGIGGAGFTKGSGWGDTANCIYYPATKEQRDTLMKAMADAGYTFDFEKKELKKIEQKPAEWSEEDERMYRGLHNLIYSTPYCDSRKELSNWLKSLKDRYAWKPSDEQMKALKEACDEHWEPDGLDPLYMLWEQLKKLK